MINENITLEVLSCIFTENTEIYFDSSDSMTVIKLFSTVTTSGILAFSCAIPVAAQVIPDETTSTTVDIDGTINNGDRAGGNLFHSFSEFSVPTGGQAFFNNSVDIVNIFSRVTGGNISNIDGLLGANGTANLFLINPAGIIFGENARLDIGGSFFGSTADSIIFSDGEFSALDADNPPLLTINAPLGLNFRDNPTDITVRGDGNGARLTDSEVIDTQDALRVDSDATFGLVGGNLFFEDATIKTAGGRIELGSVAGGQVNLNSVDNGFTLDYSGITTFRDITLSGSSNIDASGLGGGDIQVAGRNISITGVSGFSAVTLGSIPGGDINIFASESLNISGIENEDNFVSYLSTRIFPDGIADGGDINIETGSLSIGDRALIRTSVSGQGNAGDVNINATEGISLVSEGNISSIRSNLGTGAIGNSGDINIVTSSVSLSNGASFSANTRGQGNSGNIIVNATETVSLDGSSTGFFTNVFNSEAIGNGANITINANSLSVNNQASINADTSGQGNGGNITINATESISLEGQDTTLSNTGVFSRANGTANGNAGNIYLTTSSLTLNNGATISTASSSSNLTSAGNILINASDAVSFANNSSIFVTGTDEGSLTINAKSLELTSSSSFFAGINSNSVASEAQAGDIVINLKEDLVIDGAGDESVAGITNSNIGTGNAGNIIINSRNINLRNGGNIFNFNSGQGNIGDININTIEDVSLEGNQGLIIGTIGNFVLEGGTGNVGKIEITAQNLNINNGTSVGSLVLGNANSGDININVADTIIVDGFGVEELPVSSTISTSVSESGNGNSGDININSKNLFLSRGGRVSSSIFGLGNAGNINVNANVITIGEIGRSAISSGSITSSVLNDVTSLSPENNINNINAGDININTNSLSISDRGLVTASIASNAVGNGGNIEINTTKLSLTNSSISSSILTGGQGVTGSVTINATESLELLENSDIDARMSRDTTGIGGNLFLQAENLTLSGGSQISVSTLGEGNAGSATISINETIELIGQSESGRSGIFASAIIGSGNGGDLNVFTDNLIFRDGATITASNFQSLGLSQPGSGNSGDVTINAETIVAFPNQDNNIIANALQGNGGNINITADAILGIAERPDNPVTNDIDASSQATGSDGTITINNPDINPLQSLDRLPNNSVSADVIATDACSATGGETNLIIKGKGGIPPEPNTPLPAESLLLEDQAIALEKNPNYIPANIKPIQTDNGDLYPARGIVKTADGKIILTAYPNPDTTTRNLEKSLGCS